MRRTGSMRGRVEARRQAQRPRRRLMPSLLPVPALQGRQQQRVAGALWRLPSARRAGALRPYAAAQHSGAPGELGCPGRSWGSLVGLRNRAVAAAAQHRAPLLSSPLPVATNCRRPAPLFPSLPQGSSKFDPIKQLSAATAPEARRQKYDPLPALLDGAPRPLVPCFNSRLAGRRCCLLHRLPRRQHRLPTGCHRPPRVQHRMVARVPLCCAAAAVVACCGGSRRHRFPAIPLAPSTRPAHALNRPSISPCFCAAGEWLEADYQEKLSTAANTAASRLFGGSTGSSASGGSSSTGGAGAAAQKQEQRGELTPEWS